MFFKVISAKKIIPFIIIFLISIIIILCFILFNPEQKNENETIDLTDIKDSVSPIIVLNDTYVVKTGYDKNLVEVIMSADDIDSNPKREIIGEYDLNTTGEYFLTYKIEDNAGNITTKDFTLKVKDDYTYTEEDIYFKNAVEQYKTETTKLGIDVSKWQGKINWEQVKQAGVEFVFIRMGYQNGFDGEVLIDPYFEQNLQGCRQNNLPVAVYFSSYAKTAVESQEQANWICENLKNFNCEGFSVAFDWENWTSFNKLSLSLTDINNIADKFMEQCENLGYKSILYGSKTYLENVWENKNQYPIWLANYVKQTTYEGSYKLWQFCQTGIVEGISGYVDINILLI